MLLTKEVEIAWYYNNKDYYESKGYIFTKWKDIFLVKIEDLLEGCNELVEVKCDYCDDSEIYKIKYSTYIKGRKIIIKDACKKCTSIKRKESSLLLYGVDNVSKLEKNKIINAKSKRMNFNTIISRFNELNCTLLTEEKDYQNAYTSLSFICNLHKENGIQNTTWANAKINGVCNLCRYEKMADKTKLDYEYVYNEMFKYNIILLEDKYKNNSTPMNIICLNHLDKGVQTISWNTFQKSKQCKFCSYENFGLKNRKGIDFAKEEFSKKGYILLDTEYIGMNEKMKYICPKHPNNIKEITLAHLVYRDQGCLECFIDSVSGENSYRWKGGTSPIQQYFRKKIESWKLDSMKQCNYKCIITGKSFNVIHHLYSFTNIITETLHNLNFPIYKEINKYTDNELNYIEEECLRLHYKYPLGVCLIEKIHKLFHKEYGNGENTPNQFIDFKFRLQSGEFDAFLKENNLNLVI